MFSALLLLLLGWLTVTRTAQFIAQQPEIDSDSTWDLDLGPNPNDTANLVFNSVHSLSMGWPNRRYRNGHTVVPGIIPAGTSLYHGRGDPMVPATPEWTAFDFELSTLYCGLFTTDGTGCWHLTLVVERPLNIVYFDGYSGLKLPGSGTLDSQDVLAWGRVMPDRYSDEPRRIKDLCKWGNNFGIDGFVRLHTSFEVMICDFSAGLKVSSMLHINVPYHPTSPNCSSHSTRCPNIRAPDMELGVPLDTFGMGELIASKRIDEYPGETRVQLHLHRLVSFYDPSLAPSLVRQRFGQNRLQHRILGIVPSEIENVKSRVEKELVPEKWMKLDQRFDWSSLFHNIVQRYASRLELIRFDLNSTDGSLESLSSTIRTTFLQLRGILQPYDLLTARATIEDLSDDISWATNVYKACATAYPASASTFATTFTPSEKLMLSALRATNREICRTITKMWADGVNHRVETSSEISGVNRPLKAIYVRWKQDVDALMLWLDWSIWLKCNPACNTDQMCYLPMSPYLVPGADPTDDWISQARDPQPTCVPRHSR